MDTLIILATVVLPLLLGYVLGRNRDNSKIIFTKKLAIYSDIIYEINAHRYYYEKLEIDEVRIGKLIDLDKRLKSGEKFSEAEFELFGKMNLLDLDKGFLNYKDKLIKLFAPARLLGSKSVVTELREYFSLVSDFYITEDDSEKSKIIDRISRSAMELEQLMRKDLGKFRHLSKINLWLHHYINKS